MIEATVKLSGFSELAEVLETRPRRAAQAVMRKGLKKSAGLWREEMSRLVAKGFHVFSTGKGARKYKGQKLEGRTREFGVISKTIGMKLRLDSDEIGGTIDVGPAKVGFWAQWLEFGRAGQGKAPFIRPAYDGKAIDVLETFKSTIREELEAQGMKLS